MNHKGTHYSVSFGPNGWAVWIGLRMVCDGFDSKRQAITWIRKR